MKTLGMQFYSFLIWLGQHIHLVWMFYQINTRINDLIGLCNWAKRKRFDGPEKHYRSLLAQELAIYQHYGQQHRLTALFTTRLYKFIQYLTPEPRYRHKGSAAKYRMLRR